ncbi:MAG: hypothetical protein ACE5J4_02495 [Candidatus Aenigmatarchaeota archaeon]
MEDLDKLVFEAMQQIKSRTGLEYAGVSAIRSFVRPVKGCKIKDVKESLSRLKESGSVIPIEIVTRYKDKKLFTQVYYKLSE